MNFSDRQSLLTSLRHSDDILALKNRRDAVRLNWRGFNIACELDVLKDDRVKACILKLQKGVSPDLQWITVLPICSPRRIWWWPPKRTISSSGIDGPTRRYCRPDAGTPCSRTPWSRSNQRHEPSLETRLCQAVSVGLSVTVLNLAGLIVRCLVPIIAVGALVRRSRRLAGHWLLTTLGGCGGTPVVRHLTPVVDDDALDGRRGREDCVRWMKVERCCKVEGVEAIPVRRATRPLQGTCCTRRPLKACEIAWKSCTVLEGKDINITLSLLHLYEPSLQNRTVAYWSVSRMNTRPLLIPDNTCRVTTDSDPRHRLPNKTSSGIPLQDSDILAILVSNSDEATGLVNAELAREAAARRPELVPHQTAIILQLEGGHVVAHCSARCVALRQVEQAILNGVSRNSTVKLSHKIEVGRAFLASNAIRIPKDRMAGSSAWCGLQGIELLQLEGLVIPTEDANEIGAEVWHDDILPSGIGDSLVLMRSILPVRHCAGLVQSVGQLLVQCELPTPVEQIGAAP
ncbi:hypothetical protein KC364_g79 [Hortaea werneckii]|nr:hypothetical protein KC364_g79 [Hortaea werneckii]